VPRKVEAERIVLDDELVRDELLAASIVARNHAGDGLGAGIVVADLNADVIPDAQSLAAPRVIDIDVDGPHREQLARLPHPGKVLLSVSTHPARPDSLKRLSFGVV